MGEIRKKIYPCNLEDKTGWTPLHWAAKNGHFEVCKLISGNVADKNPRDFKNRTPIYWASKNGYSSIVQLLSGNRKIINGRLNGIQFKNFIHYYIRKKESKH